MTVTKAGLTNSVCNTSNLSEHVSLSTVESLFKIIKRTLESGEDVLITGFGKFCVKDKQERKGRNPETGDDMELKARRIVTFKCFNLMRGKINGKG